MEAIAKITQSRRKALAAYFPATAAAVAAGASFGSIASASANDALDILNNVATGSTSVATSAVNGAAGDWLKLIIGITLVSIVVGLLLYAFLRRGE